MRAAGILRDSVPFTRSPPLVRPYVRRGHASRVLREGKRGSTFKRERDEERKREGERHSYHARNTLMHGGVLMEIALSGRRVDLAGYVEVDKSTHGK